MNLFCLVSSGSICFHVWNFSLFYFLTSVLFYLFYFWDMILLGWVRLTWTSPSSCLRPPVRALQMPLVSPSMKDFIQSWIVFRLQDGDWGCFRTSSVATLCHAFALLSSTTAVLHCGGLAFELLMEIWDTFQGLSVNLPVDQLFSFEYTEHCPDYTAVDFPQHSFGKNPPGTFAFQLQPWTWLPFTVFLPSPQYNISPMASVASDTLAQAFCPWGWQALWYGLGIPREPPFLRKWAHWLRSLKVDFVSFYSCPWGDWWMVRGS